MKKILFIISSLVPIVIFILRYINDKNSVIKWNIICIEYVCLLIIVYIRTIFIQKKYNKLIALYKLFPDSSDNDKISKKNMASYSKRDFLLATFLSNANLGRKM